MIIQIFRIVALISVSTSTGQKQFKFGKDIFQTLNFFMYMTPNYTDMSTNSVARGGGRGLTILGWHHSMIPIKLEESNNIFNMKKLWKIAKTKQSNLMACWNIPNTSFIKKKAQE